MIDQLVMYDPFNSFLILSVLIILGFFLVLYGLSILLRNNNVVDIGWALGLPILAWLIYVFDEDVTSKQLVITVLLTLWGLRLAGYLLVRGYRTGEDWRYLNLRKAWYDRYHINAFFKIYIFQAVSMLLIALPLIHITSNQSDRFTLLNAFAGILWAVGYFIESSADLQLYQFRSDPSNKRRLLTTGLWGVSRHPNYLGELLMWWSIALIAISDLGSIWLLISPLYLTVVMYKVTGVSLMEKKLKGYEGYISYIERTGSLFPRLRSLSRSQEEL